MSFRTLFLELILFIVSGIILHSCEKQEETLDWIEFDGVDQLDCSLAETLAGQYIGELQYFEITPDTVDTLFLDTIITAANISSDYSCLLSFDGIIRSDSYIENLGDTLIIGGAIEFKGDSICYSFFQNPWVPPYPNQSSYNHVTQIEFRGVKMN